MGFPTALSAGQKATARASGYWHRTFVALNPGDVVFQCEADEEITDTPFKTFAWTTALSGAYTSVWAGMVVFISSTSDFKKNFKFRGRVRLAPGAAEFYIDLNATTLEVGDIITVIRDADLFARVREDTLVDGSITYHNLPPVTTGLPSVYALYDSDNDGSVSVTPAQVGIPVASGATIASYAWAISGVGSSSISNAAAQNPLLTFTAGYTYLVRLITTDSNGVSNFLLVQVYAITRTFAAPVIRPVLAGSISQNIDNGYTGSVTAYGGVEDLPYRTHAAVFSVEHFGDDSATPIVTNILMHGRLRSEDILTEGSAEAGQVMQVTYPIEGMTSYLSRLKVPNDIVRHAASPDEWGEMVNPTPFRMAVYFLFAYTTGLNLFSFSAGDSLFDAWRRGGEPVSIDGGYALETLNTLLSFVDAAPNAAPDGEIRCEINASYKVDRSGLVTIMDFLPTDTLLYGLNIDTSRQTAQVVGYGGSWNTVNNTFVLYSAQAPSIVFGDAPETREYNRAVLQYDSTTTEAADELGARTGNDYAFHNPKWLLSCTMLDSHRWLVATNYQRYTWTVTILQNLREIAITTAIKWQCQSVTITINMNGTYDVSAQFVQETEFLDAQSIASLLPANLPPLNPVFPVLSDYPGSPDDPLWGYPTDAPAVEELQPISPYAAWMAYSNLPPDQAAQAAAAQGTARCRSFQVLARNPGTTNSPFITVNTEPYTLKITGSGKIGTGWQHTFDFSVEDWAFIAQAPGGRTPVAYGVFDSPYWIQTTNTSDADPTGDIVELLQIKLTFSSAALTGVIVTYDLTKGSFANDPGNLYDQLINGSGGNLAVKESATDANGTNKQFAWTGTATSTSIELFIIASARNSAGAVGSITVKSITLTGTGSNPFTGDPSGNIDGDYYYYYPSGGGAAQLFGATEGGLIDGSKPAVIPPYNASHEYTVPWIGTGNAIQGNFAVADYTNVDNFAFTIQACRD